MTRPAIAGFITSNFQNDIGKYMQAKTLITAASLIALLAGCGNNGDSSQTASAPASSSAPTESDASDSSSAQAKLTSSAAVQVKAAKRGDSCAMAACESGSKAVTVMSKGDIFYACPSLVLARYTNTVVAFTALQLMASGKLPDVSPITGEPEFSGKTKDIVDALRTNASVDTFDQAVSACVKGVRKVKVTVMNNGEDESMIWVESANGVSFWMPKAYLNRV